MAVRFDEKKNLFTLQTLDSTYQMKVDDHGVLLHTYYGAPADETDFSYLIGPEDRGFSGQPGDEKRTVPIPWTTIRWNIRYRETAISV